VTGDPSTARKIIELFDKRIRLANWAHITPAISNQGSVVDCSKWLVTVSDPNVHRHQQHTKELSLIRPRREGLTC
jgi:hypothetical protein